MKFDDKKFEKVELYHFYEGENLEKIESLWATQNGNNYRIESIPFYVMEYAYQDIVNVTSDDSGELFAGALISESGHSAIRIVFFDEPDVGNWILL